MSYIYIKGERGNSVVNRKKFILEKKYLHIKTTLRVNPLLYDYYLWCYLLAIPMVFDQARGLVIMDTITLLFVHCKNVWSPVKMEKARPEILSKLQQSLIEICSPWLACMLDVPFSVNIKRNTFGNGTDARFKDWFKKFLITTAICVVVLHHISKDNHLSRYWSMQNPHL